MAATRGASPPLPGVRRLARQLGAAACGLALLAGAGCAREPAAMDGGRPQAAEAPAPRGPLDGRQVFLTQCHGCHTLGATGTPIAPDLSRIGARLSRDELERRIRDPRTHQAAAHMPRLDLDEAEIRALVAYLSELR